MSGRGVLLLLVPLTLLSLLLVLPVIVTVGLAFQGEETAWDAFRRVFTEPVYGQVLLNTLWLSCLVTASTFVFGYPAGILLATCSPRVERILISLIISSLWLSVLIRSYAWAVLLQRDGIVNDGLLRLGLIEEPLALLYTRSSVVLGMTHVLLPYMILAVWTSLKRRSKGLEQAAASLGATRTYYYVRIVVPLSRSGAGAGVLLVFLLSLGFYVTPDLLGGGRGDTMMVAMLIDQQMNSLGNWTLGSALSLTLIVVVVVLAGLAWCLRPIRAILADLFSHP